MLTISDNLKNAVDEYKKIMAQIWHEKDEKFKWRAIQTFQENWDVDAPDFVDMIKRATKDTGNKHVDLLRGPSNQPIYMICRFFEVAPEETRNLFRMLYNEEIDFTERISMFMAESEKLLAKCNREDWKSHYQGPSNISIYLWLKFPDKYYVYKYGIVKKLVNYFDEDSSWLKTGFDPERMRRTQQFYEDIRQILIADPEILATHQALLADAPECYKDEQLVTRAIDFGQWFARYADVPANIWIGKNINTGIDTATWVELLQNPNIFNTTSRRIMKCFLDINEDNAATCTEIAAAYGGQPEFYNAGATQLAKRVFKKLQPQSYKEKSYWPLLFYGREVRGGEKGQFTWKLRPELKAALEIDGLRDVALALPFAPESDTAQEPEQYTRTDYPPESANHWWVSTNPEIFSFTDLSINEAQGFRLKSSVGRPRRVQEDFAAAAVGDIVICYESNPTKQIVALGRIQKASDGEEIYIEKCESLSRPIDYKTIADIPELARVKKYQENRATFHSLSDDEYDILMELIRDSNEAPVAKDLPAYGIADFMNEVFCNHQRDAEELVDILNNNKNIILYGAPGVGKTYIAKKLAYLKMGVMDNARIKFVQFHQNYSYEDFVIGYRPNSEGGFDISTGVFYDFCQTASNQPDQDYFFIIDEINRGNLSKIFGELLMAIEADKRSETVTLGFDKRSFSVPKNLYIIGMMNTADRSLAMIDYALRRRFRFYAVEPAFEKDSFAQLLENYDSPQLNRLILTLIELNREIAADDALGRGFVIGHSYFCDLDNARIGDELKQIVEYSLIPILEEYWVDNPEQVKKWASSLRKALQDE